MATIIQVRRDTSANWTTVNPILAEGEQGYDMDVGMFKIGDGVSDWNTLAFSGSPIYTEDDPADSNPSGYMNMAVRADTLAAVTDTDGDNIALRSTNKGELYVKQVDVVDVNVTGGSITVGTVEITNDAGNPIPVSATDLDIRNLVFATDKVDISGSTLSANSGVDIGDVTINNAAGASAVNIQDGGNSVTVDAPVGTPVNVQIGDATRTATVRDTGASDSLNVAITDASGNQITTFGGASEYTEGATDASITGTAILMEGAADTLLPVQGTVADGLLVNLGGNNDVTVTGTVAVTQSGTWDEVGINDSGNSITVDDGGSSLTVDGTVGLSAGTNNIGDVDVLSLPAIPAGTNNIGDVDIASIAAGDTVIGRVKLSDGTDVADILDLTNSNPLTVAIVDANGDQITSFGGGTQYTEDAAAAANPVGTVPILIRADTPAGVATTDGDNVGQRGTNYGAAYVQVVSSAGAFVDTFGGGTQYTEGDTDATITGTAMLMEGAANALVVAQGTAADGLLVNLGTNNDVTITGDALTALQLIDDPIIVDDAAFTPATTKVMMAGFEYDDTGTDSVDEGDGGAARMSANRNVYTQIRDAAGNERGVNVNASNQLSVSVDARIQSDFTKTVGTSLLTLQTVSASSVVVGTAVDVVDELGATVFIHFGRESATAAGAGANIRIEASSKSSGEGHWYPLAVFTTAFAAASDEAVSGAEAAGQTVISVASTTGLAAGDIIFFLNGTIGNSEWHRIKSVALNTSITLEDAIVNAQTGATIYDSAEMYVAQLDLTSISRIRIVADGSLFTQAFAIEAHMITGDSIG